jgi:hypothetical protein
MRTRIPRIAGATTLGRDYIFRPGSRKNIPEPVLRFLAKAGIAMPDQGCIPLAKLDEALDKAGFDISTRFAIKGHLRAADLVEP